MRTYCCYCGDLMWEGTVDADGGVSHGICRGCFVTAAAEFGVNKEEAMEILDSVIILDATEITPDPGYEADYLERMRDRAAFHPGDVIDGHIVLDDEPRPVLGSW